MRACLSLPALAVTFCAPVLCASRAAPQTSTPNVLLIVLDDLGPENLSFWPSTGAPAVTTAYTPTLDLLAQNGIRFTSCYSQPLCSPTRACIQTGTYAFRTSLGSNPTPSQSLDPNTSTIADVLETGLPPGSQYATGLFGKWHLGALGDYDHPIQCGYDFFQGLEQNDFSSIPGGDHFNWMEIRAQAGGLTLFSQHGPNAPTTEANYTTSVVGNAARAWIDQQIQQGLPWFACVNFNVPHTPLQIPPYSMVGPTTQTWLQSHAGWQPGDPPSSPPLTRAERVGIYDAGIEAVDTAIQRLTTGLANVAIIVVGDNGTGKTAVQPPYDEDRAKGTVYDLGTRVPLIVGGSIVASTNFGAVCPRPISVVDLLPTVASIVGASTGGGLDGVNFKSLIQHPGAQGARTWALSQIFEPNTTYVPHTPPTPSFTKHDRGITDGRFHYLRLLRGGTYQEELYDLGNDPLELRDRFTCFTTPNCMSTLGYTSADLTAIQRLINALDNVSEP